MNSEDNTQEEYRDRNIVDGCAYMFKGCDKLKKLVQILLHLQEIQSSNDVKAPGHSVCDIYA